MAKSVYGTTVIPSGQITVLSGGTVQVALGEESSVSLIGGMDVPNGTATEGETVQVTSGSNAEELFGTNSELARQVDLAQQNGATPIYCTPVEETETTESISAGTSITLTDAPMDPTVHPDEEITVTDTDTSTDLTVNIVYEDPVSSPSNADTANVNPITGEVVVDASGNYDVTYTHGDYDAAITNAVAENARYPVPLTERASVINSALTEINAAASNFNFSRAVAGIIPFADTDNPDTNNYTDSIDDQRAVLVGSPRGYLDEAETEEARTAGAVAAHIASLPIGISSTYDQIDGFTSLRTELTPTEAGQLIDAQVTPLIRTQGSVTIAKDMTTSTDSVFERVYVCDIADELTEASHIVSQNYIGEQNTNQKRLNLARSHRNFLLDARDSTPTLLDAFTLNVSENQSNPNQVDVEIGLDVVNVMDTIDVTIRVGNVISFEGTN